jgi:hypothetical protein
MQRRIYAFAVMPGLVPGSHNGAQAGIPWALGDRPGQNGT